MTNSEISTNASTFRPWHFFVLGALLAATAGVLVVGPTTPAGLVLLCLGIGAAGAAGMGLYRTLWPLVASDFKENVEMIGRRTRAALEREKTLVLRSIKELEFDRAMGKVSERDFDEMSGRLRARAINLLKQLDIDSAGYRELIEQELRLRRGRGRQSGAPAAARDAGASREQKPSPVVRLCAACQTMNDPDARFCKSCGARLGEA